MSTPNQLSDTPRTDAAWAKTFLDDEDQCRAGNAATDMRDECATLERELAALAAERDQLRAENERLRRAYVRPDDIRAQLESAIARAEQQEAWSLVESMDDRQLKSEVVYLMGEVAALKAELAADRARLDWLLSRMGRSVLRANKCVAWTVDVFHYGNKFPSRAAIDAAMKEETK